MGRERDLGNEVVVKRDGCTQAIVEQKSCRGDKWGINHSQAFGSWKKLFFVVLRKPQICGMGPNLRVTALPTFGCK